SSGSTDAGKDGAIADAGKDAALRDGGTPTWTQIYTDYLEAGATIGHCGDSGCHSAVRAGIRCDTKANCYSTLKTAGYINGKSSLLVLPGSMLTWYGGAMPPGGPTTAAQATADMN